MKLQLELIIQRGWCRVTLERAAPDDIYPSCTTALVAVSRQIQRRDTGL